MKKFTALNFAGIFLVAALTLSCNSKPDQHIVTIMNPAGQPPQTPLIPRAPRMDTLVGKTIYIVDAKYPLTHQLFEEMQKLLAKRFPETDWVLKEKAGTYFDDDPGLWEEVEANGDGMILGVGH